MKKCAFLLLLCSFWLTGFAQSGSLQIYSLNNQRFWLFIDDVLQNEYSVPSIKVQGMQFQQYKIRIEIDNANFNCVGQLITISNQYNGNSYSVSFRNNSYIISKEWTNQRPVLMQNLIQPNYNYYNDYYQYLYPGFSNSENYWQDSGGKHGKPYQYIQHPSGGGHYGNINAPVVNPPKHGHQAGVNPAVPCRNPVEFAAVMNNIRRESFESGKLRLAKDVTAHGPICVEQIIQICNAFSFESNKLEYAKFAYPFCSDKNAYHLVNSVFQFQSSKDELRKIIR